MTKYVGKHRKPPKWNARKTIATTIATAGFLSPSSAAWAQIPEVPHFQPSLLPLAPRHSPPKPDPIVPEPPDLPGNGDDELNQWLADGAPGYIPDTKDSKGVSLESKVTVIQATCEKPMLPGITEDAALVYETVCALFPEITTFGGFRAGDQDHGTGNAIDAMVYDDTATGNALVEFLIANADKLHIKYLIWQQRIWQNLDGLRDWQMMEDRGSPTQNHMDHVHISVN